MVLGVVTGVLAAMRGWQIGADTAVYRAGALNLLHGGPLYGPDKLTYLPEWVTLPFIYPPAAALLFLPLAAVGPSVAWGLMTAVSLIALFVTVRAVLRAEHAAWTSSAALATALALLAVGLEPVWKTLFLGQINILLMCLVAVDVLVLGQAGRGRRWSGTLVGIAAAIKLTPLIFVVHLFVVGRRADAARALTTFLALQAVMFAVVPGKAAKYWSDLAGDGQLLSSVEWIFNQSLYGMLLRLTDGSDAALPLMLAIAAVLAVPAIALVRWFANRGDASAALLVTGFFALLVSPISWSHHWVWAVPLLALLIARGQRLVAACVLALFASAVVMLVPNGNNVEYTWGPVEVIFGNAYVLFPLVAGAYLAVAALRERRQGSDGSSDASAVGAR